MSGHYDETMGPGFFIFFRVPKPGGPDNSAKVMGQLRLMYEEDLVATIRTVVEVINGQS